MEITAKTPTGGVDNVPIRNAYDPVNLFRVRLVDLAYELVRENASWDKITDEVDIFLFNNLDLVKS